MTLSRGAQRCLELLQWYSRTFKQVYPLQSTIARKLGKTDRQVRTYLQELRAAGLVAVKKCGQAPATYLLAKQPDRKKNFRSASGLTSGLLPVCAPASITEFESGTQERIPPQMSDEIHNAEGERIAGEWRRLRTNGLYAGTLTEFYRDRYEATA